MALSVSSGIVTAASGTNALTGFSNALGVNLFGIASGVNSSGKSLFGVGAFSGSDGGISLNVNISGGVISTSVSGNIVLVTSGGTVQVSGNVTTVSGSVTNISGQTVVIAGSGLLPFMDAITASGAATTGSGLLAHALMAWDAGANVWRPVETQYSGDTTIGVVIIGQAGNLTNVKTTLSDAQTNAIGALDVLAFMTGFDGTNSDRVRTVTGSSGGSLGVLATQTVGYSYNNATGAAITNVKSGAAFLHAININAYSSGGQVQVRDASSGVAGTLIGTISPDAGTIANVGLPPASLIYDALVTGGIVISTSGANWDLTVLWRTATS